MKTKLLFILFTSASAITSCRRETPLTTNQPAAPPTVSATIAPVVSNSGNGNASNAPTAKVKSTPPISSPPPTASPTPKAAASPNVSAAPKYKNYTATGIVKGVDIADSSIIIDHEDIGDYMVAMEMPFPVVNKDSLKNLKTGDQIEFVLETGIGVERIIKIRKK